MNNEEKYLNFRKINEQETELYVYGEIAKKDWIDSWLETGNEKTNAYSLKDALALVDTPNLIVRINSYGGQVDQGLAIYGLLSDFKGKVITKVDGFACSAASIIFMAGQERIVPENGLLLIHNAWSRVQGDSNVMKKEAEDLEKITQPSVDIYCLKTGLSEAKVKEMMDKETWITSKEAFELGFATSIERKNTANQALEADYVFKLVSRLKELEKENTLLENSIKKEEVSNVKDAWASFFNKK